MLSALPGKDLLSGVVDVPDAAGAVIGNEHAAVLRDCDTYGPAQTCPSFVTKTVRKSS
jgi:hypothetical protein